MSRPELENLSPRGAQIMSILWELGSATAEEVREALPDDLHDSTVRTLLRQLEEKGFIRHQESGRWFVYSPVVERAKVQATVLRSFLKRFFGGSAEALVQRLLNDDHLTAAQLDQLGKRVGRAAGKQSGKTRGDKGQGGSR